jgi:Ser/Thr protein kinase RdoA (MazF antagonist)
MVAMPSLQPADLRPWASEAAVVGPLPGGVRNQVVAVELDGRPAVARRSGRAPAALDWELDLVAHLAANGMTVPEVIPTRDGRRHAGGLVVQRRLHGRHADSLADWELLARELRRLHQLTKGWPQRPGFASIRDLLEGDQGGDVRLDRMPPAAVAACREAWRPLAGLPTTAVHGDPGVTNVVIGEAGAGLVDWDESRVDVPLLDLCWLPRELPVEAPLPRDVLEVAGIAWEAATCWTTEPDYAVHRLDELFGRLDRGGRDRRPG